LRKIKIDSIISSVKGMKLLLVLITIFALNLSVFAQNPAEINVTSLIISKEYLRNPFISLTADGLPAPYESTLSGWGSGAIGELEYCNPCLIGASLVTTFDQNTAFWGFSLGGEKRVRFQLTGTSPDIVLSPHIRLRNRDFSRTVPAEIVGKIAVYDGNTLIAYDDEVHFTGTLVAEFLQYRLQGANGDRRGFGFRKLTFSYPLPPLQ